MVPGPALVMGSCAHKESSSASGHSDSVATTTRSGTDGIESVGAGFGLGGSPANDRTVNKTSGKSGQVIVPRKSFFLPTENNTCNAGIT